ncbi:sodium-dependent multivitamin transporter isoform X2 [Patella vulgata]|nr:sodium-dependent multivitamin transporter isoform X2 [Patella vulgata]XP_050390524.1 sodium-dependent multivitamin transporter isoform X2 [Patella vulgata]
MDDYSIITGKRKTFGVVDYVLFSIILIISAAIGFFFAVKDRKKDSSSNFLLAGRKMSVFPVAMSLLVTFLSALTLLGNPVEIYNYNTMFWYLCLAMVLAIAAASFIFIPFFYELGITSAFEYLELRFSKHVRILGCLLYIFQTMMYVSFVLYAPALALTAVTGINLWASIVGIMLIVTAYTAMGGMKAVVWTDTFQAFVIIAGLLAALIQGSILTGGFEEAWKVAADRGRVVFDVFDPDPKVRHSFWTVVFGGGIFWTSLFGLNQAQIQRAISLPSLTKAKISLLTSLIGIVFILTIGFMIGIVMFAFYANCHPIKFMNIISKADQLLPLFVMDILGQFPGIPGIFVSCVFSGSLSTLSSCLNALSAVTIEDILKRFRFVKSMNDFKITLLSKFLVVIYGVIGIGAAFLVSQVSAILQASYSLFSIINGPLSGLFVLGIFFPWANTWGAIAGSLTSLFMMSWIGFGAFANKIRTPTATFDTSGCNWNLTTTTTMTTVAMESSTMLLNSTTTPIPPATVESSDPFYDMYKLSYLWYTATAILINVVVGLIVSFITGRTKPEDLEPRLIFSIFDRLLPCLPETVLRKLRCGVPTKQKYEKDSQNGTKGVDIQASEKQTMTALTCDNLENGNTHGLKTDVESTRL